MLQYNAHLAHLTIFTNLKNQNSEQSFEIKVSMEIFPGITDYLGKCYQEQIWGERSITKEVNTPYGLSQWRPIRVLGPSIKSHSIIKVHNGNKTIFGKISG
ncbi:hypothetical protein H5410_055831 [Solanum commersonii]|uniref:Uncharacterized protein n=1 Tax=Solanum commersonii TaxID=4109 RepID=A0A9J5WIM6_SOLCO|nr:hypothetical protein H5410_055831 [Solanum commersonii]